MKFCLLTYELASVWTLEELIRIARACGFSGLEFRAEEGHGHGVELERTPVERREIRGRIEDAYLEGVGIGTSSHFDSPDRAERAANVERTKKYIKLAADVGCRRVRVFGNDFPAGVTRGDCVAYVAECLHSLGEFAEPHGVDVLLEMHGQFNYWGFSRAAVELADHARIGLVYNADPRDVVAGSVASTYSQVRTHIRHVHLHSLTDGYPYPELLGLLAADGYTGYLSSEVEGKSDPTREQYFAMYATVLRAWAGQPFFPMKG
jgi:sugar phosphate isomerase/epimerase